DVLCCPEHRALNLEAACSSLVLLENKGALPLNKCAYKRIAVVGPNADSRAALTGNYNGFPTEYITVLEGIKKEFPNAAVRYSPGSKLIIEDSNRVFGFGDMISEGAEEARRADLTILCLGLDAEHEGEESFMNNEVIQGGDRLTIGLPDTQKRLLREVLEVTDNVIIVTFCGGCIDVGDEARKKCLAHVHAWYPGELGGEAIAKCLSGRHPFTGRTPVTFYREEADLPDFTDYSMSRRGRCADPETILYPFGYGLNI
ncbi:MAG: glycoside hydrolase family 3 C-terminal domain-containing protein, partial [Clostridia bacterium]|nr:glycoside hydrolase family 3 C-terminal domain-containing protein [Clostridia bacterium]